MNTIGLGTMQVTGIAAPPDLPPEVIGMLRAMADPDLAKQLLEHQAAWDVAHEANAKQLARATKVKDLDKAIETAQAKATEAGKTLEDARLEAAGILKSARMEADEIVAESKKSRDGIADAHEELRRQGVRLASENDAIKTARAEVDKARVEVSTLREQVKRELTEIAARKAALNAALEDV